MVWTQVEGLSPGWQVARDVAAQVVETAKTNARFCYQGYRASQPMEVGWAETGLLLADEFGDGNVPAPKDIKRWWMKPMKCYRWGCGR